MPVLEKLRTRTDLFIAHDLSRIFMMRSLGSFFVIPAEAGIQELEGENGKDAR